MAFSESMFKRHMALFGEEIEVTTRTPRVVSGEVVKTTKGKIVYNEEVNTVEARIIEKGINETLFNNATKQQEEVIGLFYKADVDKLNENSRILYKGKVLYMSAPIERETHYEVKLEYIKI